MKYAIDFDGVIHEGQQPGNKMGEPVVGAQRALRDLKAAGHDIIIHTVRGNTRASMEAVEKWLDYFEIPYDTITAVKPNADVYVDDRGYHFTNWQQFRRDHALQTK